MIVDFPDATFALAGTVAAVEFELLIATTAPVDGAVPERVIVPVTTFVELPWTDLGDTETASNDAGRIVRVAFCELLLTVALRVAVVREATDAVAHVNFPVVPPTATETVLGALADFVDEVRATDTAPLPLPGVAFNVTNPDELLPPLTLLGLKVKPVTWKGLNVMVAIFVTPP